MPRWLILAVVVCCIASAPAGAACVGVETFANCTDAAGNQYTIMRSGTMPTDPSTGSQWNQPVVTGSDPYTGSQQNQPVNQSGNMTTHQGQTNGQPWNTNGANFGGTRTYNHMNSRGQPFSNTGAQFGGRR